MKLIVDIPEEEYELIVNDEACGLHLLTRAIANGIPLEKIRAEIDRQERWLLQAGYTAYNVDIAFDSIKAVVAERSDKK